MKPKPGVVLCLPRVPRARRRRRVDKALPADRGDDVLATWHAQPGAARLRHAHTLAASGARVMLSARRAFIERIKGHWCVPLRAFQSEEFAK
jgi:hypothetical protein